MTQIRPYFSHMRGFKRVDDRPCSSIIYVLKHVPFRIFINILFLGLFFCPSYSAIGKNNLDYKHSEKDASKFYKTNNTEVNPNNFKAKNVAGDAVAPATNPIAVASCAGCSISNSTTTPTPARTNRTRARRGRSRKRSRTRKNIISCIPSRKHKKRAALFE